MLKKFLRKIFNVKIGLEPLPRDERDMGFSFASLFGGEYVPKYTKREIPLPFPSRIQKFNTCGWYSSTRAREVDEKVELDPRVTVMFAEEMGLVSGDGFSNLRNNEEVMLKKGCAEKGKLQHIDNGNYSDYSNPKYLTKEIRDNANTHKTKSYSVITQVNQIYQAIDNGRTVKIGVGWRTAFNMGGGLSSPYIINFALGWLVGGHAVYVYGYDRDYQNTKVFRVRNSYGTSYGDNGDFYIKEADLQKQIDIYGAYTNLDADKDILGWLKSHQGLVVKSEKSPDVFLIQGDKKRKYDDLATLYAHGKLDSEIITVDYNYLDAVKLGEHIDFWSGGNIKMAKAIIQQRANLKPIFEKYFKEILE